LTTPAYHWYKNDAETYKSYGAYYNWYVIGTGKLCPPGWHVADSEWWVLMNFIRYNGFSAIPASSFRGKIGSWWTSDKMKLGNINLYTYIISIDGLYNYIRSFNTGSGNLSLAIRCVKD
jgi:hypothetical protein